MTASPLARSVTALTLAVGVVAALAACSPTAEPASPGASAAAVAEVTPSRTTEVPRLTSASAMQAAQAALAQCQADNVGFVTVAVVDRAGQVQALIRGDGAAAHTISAATQKGYTAAAWGAPTSELAQRVSDGASGLRDIEGTLFLPGGVPVKLGSATIAGIGVGGAPDGRVDEGCAAAGAAILMEEAAS